jgi:formylglycine-generating enzyme required for sulfatase activity
MQLIPAGALRAGTKSDDPMRGFGERAASSITLPAYCIDTYEFPNRKGMMPRGGVSYAVAEAACAKEGKRLCTENEWERACKGAKNQRFPYGEDFEEGACVTKGATGENGSVKISGDSKRCVSSFGVADLSGNLAEWTTSSFNERSSGKVIKGGSADRPDHASRCSARRHGATDKADVGALVGFRCCADPR